MNTRPPKLRQHKAGYWFVRWGGKDHYLGRNRETANHKYLTDPILGLPAWTAWRARRNTQRLPPIRSTVTVTDLVARFLEAKAVEGGPDLERYYAKHVKRFAHAYEHARADMIRAKQLQALKLELLERGYAPKTVNHDIGAVKALLRWSAGMDYMPILDLRIVRQVPLGEPPDKTIPVGKVRSMVKQAPGTMAAWLAINYLCLMRPTEVIRVVHGKGTWESAGIFRTVAKSRVRRIVFSTEALRWLAKCEPRWTRLDSYSQAVRGFFGPGGPHPLRHSAASHLVQLGVDRASVDLLLGHLPSRVSLTYAPIRWRNLRRTAARLTL